MDRNTIAIYGIGLCCALGENFATSAQAYARKERNFRRPASLIGADGFPVTIGEAIRYEEERNYADRLGRLAHMAMLDLATHGSLPFGLTTRLMLDRWIENAPQAPKIVEAVTESGKRFSQKGEIHYGGPAEALELIANAARDILDGKAQGAIVGAVSSFLESSLLDALALQGRVFSQANPYGGFPAEAACFLLLSNSDLQSALTPKASLLGVFQGRELENIARSEGLVGNGLASAFQEAADIRIPDRLVSDLSGERWRAEEFGFACSAAGFYELAKAVETPALHIGDCGCAMGPAMLVLSLAKPQQPDTNETILISASSRESGERTALLLERREQNERSRAP